MSHPEALFRLTVANTRINMARSALRRAIDAIDHRRVAALAVVMVRTA
jgi:hypothetical protein